MNQFLYYVPGKALKKEFLPRHFPHPDLAALPGRKTTCGPDGQEGHTFNLTLPVPFNQQLGYFDDGTQQWQICADGEFWIGYYTDRKPGPKDLQRRHDIVGESVTLADGNTWLIPMVRNRFGGFGSGINTVFGLDRGGRLTAMHVDPKHDRLWTLAQKFASPEAVLRMTYDEVLHLIADTMEINYFVSGWELLVLRLFSKDNLQRIFCAMLDMDYSLLKELSSGG